MGALELLDEARQAGLAITLHGDSLQIVGPESAGYIVERIRQNKAEVIAALRACCQHCAERATWPDPLADGCELHGVTADQVASWWIEAQKRDASVSFCACCAGPAPSGALVCRKCGGSPARSVR